MYKYLYEKDYKSTVVDIDRRIFNSTEELLEYMQKQGDCLFNAGFKNAEIRLYRIEVDKDE